MFNSWGNIFLDIWHYRSIITLIDKTHADRRIQSKTSVEVYTNLAHLIYIGGCMCENLYFKRGYGYGEAKSYGV